MKTGLSSGFLGPARAPSSPRLPTSRSVYHLHWLAHLHPSSPSAGTLTSSLRRPGSCRRKGTTCWRGWKQGKACSANAGPTNASIPFDDSRGSCFTEWWMASSTGARGRGFSPALSSSARHLPSPSRLKARPPIIPSVLRFPSKSRSWSDLSLRVAARVSSCHPVAACLKSSPGFGLPKEDEPSVENSVANASSPSSEATFSVKLPRRTLLVQFTCNACGERTQRLINRVAYERGTVFVQCASCLVHHKLVDNLNLVVEYDLHSDADTEFDATGQD